MNQLNYLLCKYIGKAYRVQAKMGRRVRLRGWPDVPSKGKILLELGIWISQLPTSNHHHMLSRKHKPVLHPQRQRNTLADRRSLAGFGGKSWKSLWVRHLLARTLFATETNPFLPQVTLYTWMRHAFSMSFSPCGNLEVLEGHSWPGVLTALVMAVSPNPTLCPAWHHKASHLSLRENREGNRAVFWFQVGAGKAHWVFPPTISAPCLSRWRVWLCYMWAVVAFGSW